MNKMEKVYEYIKRDSAYAHAMTLLSWDLETEAPKLAIDGLSETMEVLSSLQYENFINKEFEELIYSINEDELNEIDRKVIKKIKKDVFENMIKIPKNEYAEYNSLVTKASNSWENAKNESDYNIFKEDLKKLIITNKKFIGYRGYKDHPYNTLLDDFETGLTVEEADKFFTLLKNELSPFIIKINEKREKILGDIKERFNKTVYDIDTQKKISKEISEILGFDYNKGVIKESEHPFTTNMNNKDVRITTHYYLDDVLSGIYSTVHETGHAIYEQQVDDKYDKTKILAGGSTMGIHEAQSRFYENILGRTKAFTDFIYDILNSYNKLEINKDEFYILVNEVKSQYIRTEADELTYPIHVLIRYEIEKKMFKDLESEVDVDELKTLWDDMYEKYLGIRPRNDKEGILQDSHWGGGAFGYFPSYAIGSAYGAQMLEAMKNKVDVEKDIESKDFSRINNFLKETIHKYGNSLTPKELIFSCCNEEFKPEYYINYLKNKFGKIYLGE